MTTWVVVYIFGIVLALYPSYKLVSSMCELSSKRDMLPGGSLVALIVILWPLAVIVRIVWLLIRLYDLAEESKTR